MRSLLQPLRTFLMPLSAARKQNCLESMLNAYRMGQYDVALGLAERLYTGGEYTPSYCFFRGCILMQLGRLDEAEHWLREAIPLESDLKQLASSQSALGEVLAQQGRFEEAMESFRASLRYVADRPSTQRGIAETYLLCGTSPREAWKWATTAVEAERASKAVPTEASRLNLGEDLATLAWAVASISLDADEVDALVTEAVVLAENHAVPSAAMVHHHSGRAYAALGEELRSELHLAEAARIDPKGIWGRAARKSISLPVALDEDLPVHW